MADIATLGTILRTLAMLACALLASGTTVVAAQKARTKVAVVVGGGPAVLVFGSGKARSAKADRSHCGQRSYSVSVGNPAFKDRLAQWPGPCW